MCSFWRTWIVCAVAFVTIGGFSTGAKGQELFIRTNQLGFLPLEEKEARILSRRDLSGIRFEIVSGNRTFFDGMIGKSLGSYGKFAHAYRINFSSLSSPGTFSVRVHDQMSPPFTIGKGVYERIVDSLLLFFQVQRCGETRPYLHQVCHLRDATSLIEGDRVLGGRTDVTGGWHDAGDYVKFLNTAAYTTYTLLLAYEFHPEVYEPADGCIGRQKRVACLTEGLHYYIRL